MCASQTLIDYKSKDIKNLELQNNNGYISLMIASRYSNGTSSIETVKYLIDNGTSVNYLNKYGNTALMIASQFLISSHISTLRLLIENSQMSIYKIIMDLQR